MKSTNPNSGFHEESISKTLQTGGVDPICNQDRNVVVYALQGNGIGRSDNAGCAGCGWHENVGYTLNTVDKQAVAYTATTDNCVEVVREVVK